MSRAKVIVLSVVEQGLSKAEVARKYDVSWRWVHTLVTRYQHGGLEAIESRSTTPKTNPRSIDGELRERITALRKELATQGLDNGPVSIQTYLERNGHTPPSTSTIRRILHSEGLIVPNPKKRPKSSIQRFQAAQPNECWQSDVTHWPLADGTDLEIISWLDDHSRFLLSITVFARVNGDDVVTTFGATINDYGPPVSTLTDNGSIYTARFTKGTNRFEYLLRALGIRQKNGKPGHPQTQGKIERFHQTLKRWLTAQPPAATLLDLQQQLEHFRTVYNEHRPHRALNRATPATAYAATIKVTPQGITRDNPFRIRFDHVDKDGKATLRRAGRLHHLGIGITNARSPILMIINQEDVTVIHRDTAEILSCHDIQPERNYWRNKNREPGRWPGSQYEQ